MLPIEEVKKWLIENRTNEIGDLDLSCLDFSDFDGDIDIGGMKAKHSINQGGQSAGEDIYQSNQTAGGYIQQESQICHRLMQWPLSFKGKFETKDQLFVVSMPKTVDVRALKPRRNGKTDAKIETYSNATGATTLKSVYVKNGRAYFRGKLRHEHDGIYYLDELERIRQ